MDWAGERERDRRGMARGEVEERMMTVDGPEAHFFLGQNKKNEIRNQVKMEIKWKIPGNVSPPYGSSRG